MINGHNAAGTSNFPLMPGAARIANDGASLERLGMRFLECEAGWITFAMEAFSPEWRTCCTHLNDPFADMLRWLGEIAGGEGPARWQVAEEGFATPFVYMPPSCNRHGGSTGILIQAGSNETDLFYSWACAINPERLVSEVYSAFRGFVESDSYKAAEWEWNGVDEDDLPDIFNLDADAFKFFEARLPVWDGFSLCSLRSARVEDYLAARAPTWPLMPQLTYEAVHALLKVRAQLAAIECGVLPLYFFRGPAMVHIPHFDAAGLPVSDGAYGSVWRRMWRVFGMTGAIAPPTGAPMKCASSEIDTCVARFVDPEICASLSWTEINTLLVFLRQRALAGENDVPSLVEVRLFGAIAQRVLYLGL